MIAPATVTGAFGTATAKPRRSRRGGDPVSAEGEASAGAVDRVRESIPAGPRDVPRDGEVRETDRDSRDDVDGVVDADGVARPG